MSNFIQNRNQYNEINSQSDIYISSNPQILYSQEYVNEKGQSVSQDVYAMPAIDKTILDLLTTNEGVDTYNKTYIDYSTYITWSGME